MTQKELATDPQVIAMASALVHAHEALDLVKQGLTEKTADAVARFDIPAFETSLEQVQPLLAYMDKLALLPVRRDGKKYHKR